MSFKAKIRNFFSPTPLSEIEDKGLGCIMGGAIGDALGYPVEFCSHDDILGCKKIPHGYLKNLEKRQLIKEMTMKLISCTERR